MRNLTILFGAYGSGKTEIAIQLARNANTSGKKVVLVDLDIINPYFRSADKKALLQSEGIEVVVPAFANSNIEMPVLTAEVGGLFSRKDCDVFMDVGGDPIGANALGGLHNRIAAQMDYEALFVVNCMRPYTSSLQEIISIKEEIETNGRLKATGLINNTNLARETTADMLLEGHRIVSDLSSATKLPINLVCGSKEVLDHFLLKSDYGGPVLEMGIIMRPEWLDM